MDTDKIKWDQFYFFSMEDEGSSKKKPITNSLSSSLYTQKCSKSTRFF